MQFEAIRVSVAVAGLLLASYYDLFNRRNVPSWLTYSMLGAGILFTLAGFDAQEIANSAVAAVAVLGLGYLVYRSGQIGGADVLIFAALALLLPIAPAPIFPVSSSAPAISLPFIVAIFIASGLFSIIGISATYVPKVLSSLLKGNVKVGRTSIFSSAVIVASYAFVLYFMHSAFALPVPQLALIAMLVILAAFLMLFKEHISESMIEWVPFSKIDEEDIIALEKLDPGLVARLSLGKVLTPSELGKLKKTKLKTFPIFKGMPPFVPYITLGLAFLLLFGDLVLLLFA